MKFAIVSLLLGLSPCSFAQSNFFLPVAQLDRLGIPETLLGILSYARWPNESNPLRLCVLGRSIHAEQLLKNGLTGLAQRPITVQRLATDQDTEGSPACDALYVAASEEAAWRRIASQVIGQPVLTFCERSPVCAAGGMVCLDISENTNINVQFEINLDSVARSGVRLNPQVLRLGRHMSKVLP